MQGDQEKAQGRNPIPMMDRDRAHELPANQVRSYDIVTFIYRVIKVKGHTPIPVMDRNRAHELPINQVRSYDLLTYIYRVIKIKGHTPIPIMDRDVAHKLLVNQVKSYCGSNSITWISISQKLSIVIHLLKQITKLQDRIFTDMFH